MALAPGAPVGFNPNAPAVTGTVTPNPYTTTPLTPEQMAEADVFFAELEPEADYERWKYMCVRVPAHIQQYFLERYPDPTAPPPEGGVLANPNPNLDPNVVYDPRVPAR